MCRVSVALAALLLSLGCSRQEKRSEPPPVDQSAKTASDPSAAPGAGEQAADELPATPVEPEPPAQPEAQPEPQPEPQPEARPEPGAKPEPGTKKPGREPKPAPAPGDAEDVPAQPDSKPGALPAQGQPCQDGRCARGLTCIEYYGIAGPRGPRMGSCEIRCVGGKVCPSGQHCTTIADGPGQVCRPQ